MITSGRASGGRGGLWEFREGMGMLYRNGTIARLGDRVRLNDTEGVVVLSIDTNEYTPDFTREDWAGLLERGVLIDFEKRGLIHYIEPDEDLDLVARADE